jgi:hypothetical protein
MSKLNVDNLFKQKFEEWESAPGSRAWQGLESELKKKKRKKLYFRLAVAASILLLFSFSILFLQQLDSNDQPSLTEGTMSKEDSQGNENNDNKTLLSEEAEVSKQEIEVVSKPQEELLPNENKETETNVIAKPLPSPSLAVIEELPEKQEETIIPVNEPQINEMIASEEVSHPEEEGRAFPPITIEYRSSGKVARNAPENTEKKGIVKQIQVLVKEVKDTDISLARLRDAKDDFLAFEKKEEKKEEKKN